MFGLDWSEIALIGIVALIAIGPKDLPVAIRAISGAMKKARRMAGEFQTHVDEMVREANLDEVRTQFSELRRFNFKDEIEKHVDPKRELRDAFVMTPAPAPASTGPLEAQVGATVVAERAAKPVLEQPAFMSQMPGLAAQKRPEAPAFIPPGIATAPPRPAFIPPGAPAPRA